MPKIFRSFLAVFALLVTALACANPLGGSSPNEPAGVETIVAATFQALTAAATQPETGVTPQPLTPGLLPHSMYFLNNDSAGLVQVYRLGTDGKTVTQITFEPAKVEDYDVSLVDGSVVYVSNNQMFTVNADGSNRRMILDGGVRDENNPFLTAIISPVFSPNGQTIAYGYKGLNFYSVSSGQSNRVLENDIDDLGNGMFVPREMFWPEKYTADGSKLLITLGYYEGAGAAIYYPNGNALVRLSGDEGTAICCGNTEWVADGSAFYAASATSGMFNAGLWRVDAATGKVTTLLLGSFDTNPANVASSPFLAPDGQLYFFHASIPNAGDMINRPPLQLVRSAPDGVTNRAVLRPETFESMNEALWAPDASFVIIADAPIQDVYQGGLAELVYTDGQKDNVSLVPFALEMKWGP
jgi:Tol biopolymer transport system component